MLTHSQPGHTGPVVVWLETYLLAGLLQLRWLKMEYSSLPLSKPSKINIVVRKINPSSQHLPRKLSMKVLWDLDQVYGGVCSVACV